MKGKSSGGFTIVETMIVLGVMSVLFVSLVSVMRGQQSKAQFRTAVSDLTTQLQDYISQVSTGYYPKNSTFSCTTTSGAVTLSNASSSGLGENDACTYMGQAIIFSPSSMDPSEIYVYTLVGTRRTMTGDQPRTLREAGIQVLAKGNSFNNSNTWPDYPMIKQIAWGSSIAHMKTRVGNRNIAGLAIVSSPAQELTFSTTTDQLEAGSMIPIILPILNPSGGSNFGVPKSAGVDLVLRSIGNVSAGQQLPADSFAGPLDICLASGTNDQSAHITIGSNNSTTSIDFEIENNRDCS